MTLTVRLVAASILGCIGGWMIVAKGFVDERFLLGNQRSHIGPARLLGQRFNYTGVGVDNFQYIGVGRGTCKLR